MDWISSAHYVPFFDPQGAKDLESIFEPGFLQRLEGEILSARERQIPESSNLHTLADLRSKETVPDILAYWMDSETENGEDMDREVLWDVLLGRRKGIPFSPDTNKEECPDLGDDESLTMKVERLLPLVHSLSRRIGGRKVFITRSGFAGVGSATLEEGDVLVLPFGAGGFYIFRPSADEERYQMVGFAYVSGLMDWNDIDTAYRRGVIEETVFRVN